MKRKNITIGNKDFTITNKTTTAVPFIMYRFGKLTERTLNECYTRPSKTKQAIYKEWVQWANENNAKRFGVCSYNTNIFTLDGLIKIGTDMYYIYITPTRQELTRVVDMEVFNYDEI